MTDREREIIEQLYRHHLEKMHYSAMAILRNIDLADEAVQQTFLDACRKPEKVLNHPNPEAWFMAAVRISAAYIVRQEQKNEPLIIDMTEYDEDILDLVSLETLYPKLSKTKEFQLLKRFAADGESISSIARESGASVSAVKKRIERAKKKLKKYIKR